MPQPPEENKEKKDGEQPAPVVPDGPTIEELNTTLQAERQRAMHLEADRQRLATELYTRRDPAPADPGADPYANFTENVLTSDPKESQRVLKSAVRNDVSRAINQVRGETAQILNQQRVEFEATRALDRVMSRFPELADPANQSKFAGLITKAQVDAQAQGLVLDMSQIADRAAREYGTLYGKRQPNNVPYVEGAGNPQAATIDPNQPVNKNGLEEAYGMEAGTIEPIQPAAMKEITRGYVKDKNKWIRGKGTGSSLIITAVTEAS